MAISHRPPQHPRGRRISGHRKALPLVFIPLATSLLAACALPDAGDAPWRADASPPDAVGALAAPEGAGDGARKPSELPLVVSPEIEPSPPSAYDQHAPSAAFDGQSYLVVWSDSRDSDGVTMGNRIYGARVSPAGVPLDSGAIAISTGLGFDTDPIAVFDGESTLVIWKHADEAGDGHIGGLYQAARVSPSGALLDAQPLQLPDAFGWDDESVNNLIAASNGEGVLVAFSGGGDQIYRSLVGQDGAIEPAEPLLPAPDTATIVSGIASDGAGYLVTWTRDDITNQVSGVLLGPTGESVGDAFEVSPPDLFPSTTAATFDGANYLVLWEDGVAQSIFATRVSPAGVVLNPAGSLVADVAPYRVAVAASGERSIGAWSRTLDMGPASYDIGGAEFGQDGVASPTFDISTSHGTALTLAGGPGGQVLVGYAKLAESAPPQRRVVIRLLDPEGGSGGSGGSGAGGGNETGGGGAGSGGDSGTGAGGGGQAGEGPIEVESCGCSVPGDEPRPSALRWLAVAVGLLALRRVRRGGLRAP